MKITGLSSFFKWENLHNWWLTKYFFAPLYITLWCSTEGQTQVSTILLNILTSCLSLSIQKMCFHVIAGKCCHHFSQLQILVINDLPVPSSSTFALKLNLSMSIFSPPFFVKMDMLKTWEAQPVWSIWEKQAKPQTLRTDLNTFNHITFKCNMLVKTIMLMIVSSGNHTDHYWLFVTGVCIIRNSLLIFLIYYYWYHYIVQYMSAQLSLCFSRYRVSIRVSDLNS